MAVAGVEGFLFIGDGANRWEQQYLGELAVAQSWLDGWCAVLAARQGEAGARGLQLWNFVVPEKQVVLPDKRWLDGEARGSGRPLKRLMEVLSADARLLYPEAALREAQALAPTYFRHNSHWTCWGCCAAVGVLLEALSAASPLADLDFAAQRLTDSHDLTSHFFAPPPREEMLFLTPVGEMTNDNRHLLPPGRHQGATYTLRNPEAPDPRRLILFGDSYAYEHGLSFVLGAAFAEVVFVWSKSVIWDLVDKNGADLVVWESAERYLATLPQA